MMVDVAIVDIQDDIDNAVATVFDQTVPRDSLIKESGEVYIKPNGIDFKPYAYTAPVVLEATIRYIQRIGASKVFVMENSTQANITRGVFKFTGYDQVCKTTGAKPIFLDEEKGEEVKLEHFDEPVEFPRVIVEKIINEKHLHTYISLPKLKTHSMSTVTLGIKNQMAFPSHSDRGHNHNHALHRLLADFYLLVQPDYTLIDGTYAVFNGHYPLQHFLDESLDKLDILIGGRDTLAVDVVGAKVLGYGIDEVPHLHLVQQDWMGKGNLDDIDLSGDISRFTKRYPCTIIGKFPEDVRIIKGEELLCKEGCDLNVRMVVQLLHYDHGGEGGFTILMGKGLPEKHLASVTGKILIAGDCAIDETYDSMVKKVGRKNVFTSPTCNRLAATTDALCKIMGVNVLALVPSKAPMVKALIQAKLHGSKALIPSLF